MFYLLHCYFIIFMKFGIAVYSSKFNKNNNDKTLIYLYLFQFQHQMKDKEEKLRMVRQIIENDDGSTIPVLRDSSDDQVPTVTKTPGRMETRSRKVGVSNPRYRRSQSADRWVDHRPEALIPVGTVLQPLMRRRRSVTKLTSPKEITDGASRYCLTAQNQDSEGELETKLYKVS